MLVQTNEPKNSLSHFNFGDCCVAFPEMPQTIKTEYLLVEDEPIELRKIIFENALETYLFARARLSNRYLQKGSREVLNEMTRYFLGEFDCEELEEYAKHISYENYPGREFKIVEDKAGLVMRLYLVERKLYLLLVASDRLQEATKAIDSFKLISTLF